MHSESLHKSRTYFYFLCAIFLAFAGVAVLTSNYWLAAIPFVLLLYYFGWQHWQLVFFMLVASLPWSVEYNFNPSLGTDLPDEPLMWLTATFFIAHFFFKPYATTRMWKHPFAVLLVLYFLWIIVTVSFSTEWLISLKFLLAKSWYIIAFMLSPLLIFTDAKAVRTTALLFLFSMLLVTLVSLYRHFLLGFTFANINEAVRPFFRNHVNYSAMLVCTIPLLVATYQLTRKYRFFVVGSICMVLTAVFFSYSRGAWIALLAGASSYWLIQNRKLLVSFIVFLLLTIGALFWLKDNDRYLQYAHDYKTTIFHKDFEQHLIATYKLKDVSTAERFNRWIAGVRMIKDNWLTGYGPNTFYNNYKPYTLPVFKTWVSSNKEHSTVHNYFLLVAIEQGVPGLLFFLLLVGAGLFYSEHIYHRAREKFERTAAMACGVMLVMIIVVNFLSDLIETDKVGSLFFLCMAALVTIDKATTRRT
jgi:O-antigen ligase